jgi:hypothetical protein
MVIDGQRAAELPMVGGNAFYLSRLSPGVTNTAFGTITAEKGHGQRQWTFGLKLMF